MVQYAPFVFTFFLLFLSLRNAEICTIVELPENRRNYVPA